MQVIEITQTQLAVLNYLKKQQKYSGTANDVLIYFGVGEKDIVKYIEHPDACGRWPLDFVWQVEQAIEKISRKYMIEFPPIEEQTEEDRVLSRLLQKRSYLPFGTNIALEKSISAKHVIEYMQRNEVIYDWNPFFVMQVAQEVKRIKQLLL